MKSFAHTAGELAARWYVFLFLNIYGIAKIAGGQFYRRGKVPTDIAGTPLGDASAFDLAWVFMGYSFGYILFIGLAEIIGAWLLLWDRTKLLGVAILLPVMVNVIVFDVFFLDAYGALASATIYTLLLIAILILNKEAVTRAIRALIPESRVPFRPQLAFAAFALMAVLFLVDQLLVNFFGHGRG